MDEFGLIAEIVGGLPTVDASWLRAGPGDDAAISRVPDGFELASSIDSFLADTHFPGNAAPELIAYRSLMGSLSDLAAMGADPAWALVALSLPEVDRNWVADLTRGFAAAARKAEIAIVGGNLACGPLALTISVHGWAPAGALLLRSGARPGDALCVSGPLGGAARALATLDLSMSVPDDLSALERCYWRPQPPFALAPRLREHATSCVDVSDGLLQDIGHLCAASGCGVEVDSTSVPLAPDADIRNALGASDDYVLCFTTRDAGLIEEFAVIGWVTAAPGLLLDGKPVNGSGYRHF